MSPQLAKYLLYALLSLSLVGCPGPFASRHYQMAGNTDSLQALTQVHAIPQKNTKDTAAHALRLQSIKEYAFSISAQIACAHHTKALEQLLNTLHHELDRVYSFTPWLLNDNVLPPILIQAKQSIHLSDDTTIRIAGQTYQIKENAKFVSTAPHWLYDYLLKDAAHLTDHVPKTLLVNLLPKNPKEQALWKATVTEGWKAGIEQACNSFLINLNTLERDLKGLILYRQLLAKGMITAPYVAYTNLGITGDESHLNINDQLFRLTTLPTLQHQTDSWDPLIIDHTKTDSNAD